MRTLDDILIYVPIFGTDEEWREAEDEVEPPAVPMVRLQAALSGLLARRREQHPTPTTAAWLVLWTRAFQGLEGLRGAVHRRSLYTARILERALFETAVHLYAIARPFGYQDWVPEQLRIRGVRDRLHAYLSWCIWCDLRQWEKYLHPANLKAIYDPQPARDYVRKYPGIAELSPDIWGEVEVLSDVEAERERKEHEDAIRGRIAVYERWLSDDRLEPFAIELRTRKISNFLQLLDADEKSILAFLKASNMRMAYSIYARTSDTIHGSSLEGILSGFPTIIAPQIGASEEDVQRATRAALTWARHSLHWLAFLRLNGFTNGDTQSEQQ